MKTCVDNETRKKYISSKDIVNRRVNFSCFMIKVGSITKSSMNSEFQYILRIYFFSRT